MRDSSSSERDLLTAAAQSIPDAGFDVEVVVAEGQRRRRRQRLVGTGLAMAAGTVFVFLSFSVLSGSGPTVDIATTEDIATENTTNESVTTETVDPAESGTEDAPLRVESVESSPAPQEDDTPTGTLASSASDVLDLLSSESVLFWSDGEGCEDLSDPRHHPQWSLGQTSDQLDANEQPTYGYAFNTGQIGVDIDWRFSTDGPVRAGNCGIAIDLLQAKREATGVRLFRRYDQNGEPLPPDAFYSAWFYIPEEVVHETPVSSSEEPSYWTVMQLKNMVNLNPEESPQSMSAFSLMVDRESATSDMSLAVHNKVVCGAAAGCSDAVSIRGKTGVVLPVGQWVHIELGWSASEGDDGRLRVWQDGVLTIDYTGATERPNTVRRTWNLASSGRHHLTTPHRLYVDDVLISREPAGPLLFGSE